MKTLRNISGAFLLATLLVACGSSPKQNQTESTEDMTQPATGEVAEVSVDLGSSNVNWKGEMLGIYPHYGTVDLQSASLTMQGGMVSDGQFVINLQSMTATDDNYSEERPKERLIGHLKSSDFFDVENYPTASFVINEVSRDAVSGDLTIRGITHSETIEDVSIRKEGDTYMISGKLVFDRQKYDVKWETGVQDRVLSNDIEIQVELVASA